MRRWLSMWAVAGIGLLAGCAAPQPDAALTGARQQVATAANNADVVAFAQPQLQTAQGALGQAEASLEKGDMAAVDHYAFLASRYTETAQQVAQRRRSEQVVANAPIARSQVAAQQAQAEAQRAQTEAQRAREEAAQARSSQGLVITPRDILFAPGSAVIDANASATLQQVAQYLRANPGRRVLIEGFTDSTGDASVNQQLSQQRADAVRLALANQGVDASRIAIRGMGPSEPIASNASSAGRLLNRRVSIVISNADGTFPQAATGSSAPMPPIGR